MLITYQKHYQQTRIIYIIIDLVTQLNMKSKVALIGLCVFILPEGLALQPASSGLKERPIDEEIPYFQSIFCINHLSIRINI